MLFASLIILALSSYFASATKLFRSPRDYSDILLQSSDYPVGPYGLNNIKCQQSFYQIPVNSTNTKFVGLDQSPQNQSYITSLLLQYTTSRTNFTEKYIDGTFPFSETFNISGTLCTPVLGAKANSAIQVLVHGIGFDSSYWDFSVSFQATDTKKRKGLTC